VSTNVYPAASKHQNIAHPTHMRATTPGVAHNNMTNIFSNPAAPHPYNRPVTSNHDPFGLETHVIHNVPLIEGIANQVVGVVNMFPPVGSA
jgi:hypothetical protein